MNKGVLIWGYLSSFILLLGAIFMNLNFIAGKVLYLTGFFAFNLGYLVPLFLVIFKENQENKIGLVIVFGILGFLTFLTGVSFFVVNWGGGIVLIYIGGGILLLAILTIIALSRRFYETHIDAWFPVLIFGVFIVVSLLTGMVHRHVMRVFTINNKESIQLLNALKVKNVSIYNQLYLLDTSEYQDLSVIYNNVKILRAETQLINKYIDELKISLVSKVEGEAYKILKNKSLENLVPIQSNVEINAVNRFMLKQKKAHASELKKQINLYHQSIVQLIPNTDPWLNYYTGINLNTETLKLNNRHFNKSWEKQQFYSFPLVTVINQLSKIQMSINLVESEILNFYYREALKLSKGNIELIINQADSSFTISSQ